MIGIIVPAVKGYVTPFDPDTAFDPTTHIATEEAFIQLLENGIYDEKYIGYMVTLSNSAAYNNGVWVIADVNHDSANTGQTDCYDLISRDCFHYQSFNTGNGYRSSSIRTWLNGTCYTGFSTAFKLRLMQPKYQSDGTWYDDDKMIIPSYTELTGESSPGYYRLEGTIYSILSTNVSRIKYPFEDYSYAGRWWTRTISSSGPSYYWYVGQTGSVSENFDDSLQLAPIIRVH